MGTLYQIVPELLCSEHRKDFVYIISILLSGIELIHQSLISGNIDIRIIVSVKNAARTAAYVRCYWNINIKNDLSIILIYDRCKIKGWVKFILVID